MRAGALRALFAAALLALGLSIAPIHVPVALAAAPELQITTDARYDVRPTTARVHITLDATITNTHRDAAGVRTYYDTAFLAVLPGTANFRASSPGAKPTVSIRSQTRPYTLLTLRLGQRLYAGRHIALRLEFDLPDRGGTAQRDVRVSTSLIAFPVWAFATADTPGSSVTVVFPPGYSVQQQAGDLPDPAKGPGGTLIYASGSLAKPLSFYSYFVADRPGAFKETRLTASVAGSAVPIVVRAWEDDPGWGTRVGSLLRRGLPALSSAIGLPYRGTGLIVQESVSRTIGGYAGVFDPAAATIQVAYYAGAFVVLHEAAHAWFNGTLASDRWILEAFASWYARQAAATLKITADLPELTADLRAAAIPLNAWPGVGRADETTEDYAYAATFQLASLIAARAGAAGLGAVWQAAENGEYAYQPVHAGGQPETGAPPPDWRGLLDLIEERTHASVADLWTRWVVRPTEAHLLDERAAARAAYASAVREAGDWELPPAVRQAMSAWQFAQAETLIGQSRLVLQQRAAIESAATVAGLTLPHTLEAAFEGPDGPSAAGVEASRELETIDMLVAARASSGTVNDGLSQLGLLGMALDEEMREAQSAFADGDLDSARRHAVSAQASWEGAAGRGAQRLVIAGAGFVALVALVTAVALAVRARRARRVESSE